MDESTNVQLHAKSNQSETWFWSDPAKTEREKESRTVGAVLIREKRVQRRKMRNRVRLNTEHETADR